MIAQDLTVMARQAIMPLRLLLVGTITLPLIYFAATLVEEYSEARAESEHELLRISEVAREHTARVFDIHRLIAGRIDALLNGRDDQQIAGDERRLHEALQSLIRSNREVDGAFVIGREGEVLVSTNAYPTPPLSVRNRDYFAALRDGDAGSYISQVYTGLIGGVRFFSLNHRRQGAAFNGLISTSVWPASLRELHLTLLGASDIELLLIRDDGVVLAQSAGATVEDPPAVPDAAGMDRLRAWTPGSVLTLTDQLGRSRMAIMQPVQNYAAYVLALRPPPSMLSEHRVSVWKPLLFAIPATLALMLITRVALRRTQLLAMLHDALAQSRLRLRLAFHGAPDCLLLVGHGDTGFLVEDASDSARQLLARGDAEIIGRAMGELFDGAAAPAIEQLLARCYATGQRQDAQLELVTPAGEPGWFEVSTVAIARRDSEPGPAVLCTLRDITERSRVEAERTEMRRRLAAAQEAERARVARELHDQMGQGLVALSYGLKELESGLAGSAAQQQVRALQGLASQIGADMHRVAIELRPPALDDFGLERVLSGYLRDWGKRTGTHADIQIRGADERLPRDIETAIFRVVQEALNNVAKHARARNVSIVIDRSPTGDLHLIIEDDGIGLPETIAAGGPRTGLGLRMMKERLALVGGSLTIEAAPGAGTTLYVRVPVGGTMEVAR